MNKFWIVLFHTYLTKLKTRTFIVSTVISMLLIFAVSNLSNIISFFNKESTTTISVIDQNSGAFSSLAKNAALMDKNLKLTASDSSEEDLKKKVLKEEIDGYLVLTSDQDGLPKASFKAASLADSTVSGNLEKALQQTKMEMGTRQLGLDQAQLQKLLQPAAMEKTALQKDAKSEEELNQARGLVYVMLFVIYLSVIMYANMIAMEVATEKASRVMEILISSVSPVKQMFAKILGIGLLSVTQLALILIVGYSSVQANAEKLQSLGGDFFSFSNIPLSTVIYCVVFFLLGYFLYATLAAFLGSLVSRIEDVQQMVSPMTFIIVAAFMIAMFGLGAPEAPFITATSFIPFFAPMIMFLRVGMLNVPFWEVGLSIILMLVLIFLLAYFGAKIYKGGVLMYGKSSSYKDFKKAMELSKDQ
ncbi:ABC transporter permease [Metabacillus sp. GX 13764]|uniref:ABC transporter permease n=1 Tax=Metabacillus kandeliae TaxID=2900151 RepID=UPI001E434BE2|nr:ABC transporter permease [Metabacillus kandeliae]MCD7034844.1 ABC transporter permease [Metabacillus kandeliae]